MSLEIIKEALGILDTIGKLPTGAITFTNAITTIFQVISAILQVDGKAGWSTIANEAIGKGVLTLEDEKDLKPLTDLLIQLKYANKDTPLENLQKGGGSVNPDPDLDKLFAKGVNKIKEVNKTVSDFSATFGITKFGCHSGNTSHRNTKPTCPLSFHDILSVFSAPYCPISNQ